MSAKKNPQKKNRPKSKTVQKKASTKPALPVQIKTAAKKNVQKKNKKKPALQKITLKKTTSKIAPQKKATPKKPVSKKIPEKKISAKNTAKSAKTGSIAQSVTVKKVVTQKKAAPAKKTAAPKKSVPVTKKPVSKKTTPIKQTPAAQISATVQKKQIKALPPIKTGTVKKTPATPFLSSIQKTGHGQSGAKSTLPSPFKKSPAIKPKYFFNSDLPGSYKKTYLRALPRDPYGLFLYWEFSDETIEKAKTTLGIKTFEQSKPILRLYDVTGITYNGSNALSYFDTGINYYTNNWYLQVPRPGHTYLVEYGLITAEGVYYLLSRSNTVQIPRDAISDTIDESWSTLKTDEILRYSTDLTLGASQNRPLIVSEQQETGLSQFLGASENFFPGSSENSK